MNPFISKILVDVARKKIKAKKGSKAINDKDIIYTVVTRLELSKP